MMPSKPVYTRLRNVADLIAKNQEWWQTIDDSELAALLREAAKALENKNAQQITSPETHNGRDRARMEASKGEQGRAHPEEGGEGV